MLDYTLESVIERASQSSNFKKTLDLEIQYHLSFYLVILIKINKSHLELADFQH